MTRPGATPARRHVHLADLTAKQLACLLAAPLPELCIDCDRQRIPHLLGVCHFVTQLLHLRRRGAGLWLHNVHPVLQHCLHQLGLDDVLHLNE